MSLMTRKYELPEMFKRSRTEPGSDPAAAEAEGTAILNEVSPLLLSGITIGLPIWLTNRTAEVLRAWMKGPLSESEEENITEASMASTVRVSNELRALFAQDPALQRETPLSIVRGSHREPGLLLLGLGVGELERDPFEERALPEDRWSLSPPDLASLGEDLGPLLLAWGLAKARVLRSR